MTDLIKDYSTFLTHSGKSVNTVKTYSLNVQQYFKWFRVTYAMECTKLYRENVLDYKSYLLNIKKYKGRHLSHKTVNGHISALVSFNAYLIKIGTQSDFVISKDDFCKVQIDYANPCTIQKSDVERFRQEILEAGDKRLYAMVTILAYSGLRISELLNTKTSDINLQTKELVVRKGKGGKQRIVYLNTKIVNAMRAYLSERRSDSEYLFPSREREKLDRTVVNKQFKRFSSIITPHSLRHFWCTNALESGYSIHETMSQAGHSNVKTTMLYAHPSREEMKRKAELL
jgi:integrase/recombinase XerD